MLSVFDLYSVGIGPSSSHTVGPMRAAKRFVDMLADEGQLSAVARVQAQLFGSLGATGHGHGSAKAVVLGLQGEDPATVDTDTADAQVARAAERRVLRLAGRHEVGYDPSSDVVLHRRRSLPAHPNGMIFAAYDAGGALLAERTYYSVGGGFIHDHTTGAGVSDGPEAAAASGVRAPTSETPAPLPFSTGAELLAICADNGLRVSDVVLANELTRRSENEVRAGLLDLWRVMVMCVEAGCQRDPETEGVLPGGLRVRRRAPALFRELTAADQRSSVTADPLRVIDWVNLFALAVNEENASGGRIVTAPTNGAAGIIPAVLLYFVRFVRDDDEDSIVRFLLTAAAIGTLIKTNASISGAEVGCQGEVGSACAMAAAALCEVLGGTPAQIENAAEIGLEHNLGLTCDPVGGLVQIPCIERNAIAAVQAINAARLAIHGDGTHKVSLDKAIKTLRETGRDMHIKYKETSRGGLAVNVVEC